MIWRKGRQWAEFGRGDVSLRDTLVRGDPETVLELATRLVGEAEAEYGPGYRADTWPQRMTRSQAIEWLEWRGYEFFEES